MELLSDRQTTNNKEKELIKSSQVRWVRAPNKSSPDVCLIPPFPPPHVCSDALANGNLASALNSFSVGAFSDDEDDEPDEAAKPKAVAPAVPEGGFAMPATPTPAVERRQSVNAAFGQSPLEIKVTSPDRPTKLAARVLELEHEKQSLSQALKALQSKKEKLAMDLDQSEGKAAKAMREQQLQSKAVAELEERAQALTILQQRTEEERLALSRDNSLLTNQVDILKAENESLRQRDVTFKALEEKQLPKKGKKVKEAELIANLQAQVKFYEEQLRESDATLSAARQTWGNTSQVLMTEVNKLETKLAEANRRGDLAMEGKATDQQQAGAVGLQLSKAIADRSKLSELVNEYEMKWMQAQMEVSRLQDANQELKEALAATGRS